MQQPKGIAVVLGVIFGLLVIGAVIGGVLLFKDESKTKAPVTNTNTALQLGCSVDADCSTYCGADPCYQPICGVTTIGEAGSCTCRSICGPIVTSGNTNTTTNTNASNTNTSANTNAATNTNNTVSTTSWKLYTNTELGFTLKFPSTWEGYTVGAVTSNNSIKFTHPKKVSSKGNPGEVSFIITRLNKGVAIPQGSSLIQENANYTFVYSLSNAAAPDEMNDYWEQIPTILSTFTFTE